MQLQGAWPDALAEAERAGRRLEEAMNQAAAAKACYLKGEVHRLRGEFGQAEEAYRQASQLGLEPQPGWALVRLAQGNAAAAAAAIRRALGETTDRPRRAGLLPAESRSCSRPATSTRRGAPSRARGDCVDYDSEMLRAPLPTLAERSSSRRGTRPARL